MAQTFYVVRVETPEELDDAELDGMFNTLFDAMTSVLTESEALTMVLAPTDLVAPLMTEIDADDAKDD